MKTLSVFAVALHPEGVDRNYASSVPSPFLPVALHPEKNNRAKVYKLYNDNRLNFYAPADYTERSNLYRYMQQIIDEVAAREQIKSEREILRQPAEAYKMRSMLEKLETGYPEKLTPQEITELQKLEAMIKSRTPGEID